jgi:hemolysin III
VKPRLRGLSHFVAFFVAIVASLALVFSPRTGLAYVGGLVYAASIVVMFGISGMYHWLTWSFRTRRIFRQLDHSGIFFLIAGTYSAYWSLSPEGSRSLFSIWLMWGSAIFGVIAFVFWTDMHRALRAATYVVIGVSTAPHAFKLPAIFGWWACALVLGGGVVYIAGALVYARRWPNPDPKVFGYHEVFHVMVIIAAVMHFSGVVRLHWA